MQGQTAANDGVDYERIGRFIYSFHRICGSVDKLTASDLANNAPPELAERAANLAERFQYILKNSGHTAEAELTSTLREAVEVQKGIEEWQSKNSRR